MSNIELFAPRNPDEQRGFDNAFFLIATYWDGLSQEHRENKEAVFDQMDSFVLGIMLKLMGGTEAEAQQIIKDARRLNNELRDSR